MEACPKLPMLSFDYKISPDNSNFTAKLRALIQEHYHEDPNNYSQEIHELEQLRANACIRPSLDIGGVSNIQKYYCQLHFLENRFKITEGQFDLPWYDIYLGVVCNYTDINYEKAASLYNYGAVHSMLGSQDLRSTSEGMKVACTHYQCAAWAFHTLPDRYPTQVGSDLSTDLLAFLAQVCLAQAQECILEKSILDHRKHSIIAKVCAQVVEYYKAAFRKIESSNSKNEDEPISECVGEKKSKSWTKYVEFKLTFYTSLSYLFMGFQSEESQKMGERVAYFKAASDVLEKTGKMVKGLDGSDKSVIVSCLNFASDVINGKYENSKKENEFVYHEKVPDLDSLPELKGASLVKGLGFEVTDPDISGPDIFNRIVPMEAHESSSLYSEEKAKLLRQIGDEIEEKDSELAIFMSSLQLEEVPNPGDDLGVPLELIECVAAFSVKNNEQDCVQRLTEAMGRIASISSDVESSIQEIENILSNEKEEQTAYEAIVGTRPEPLNAELTTELNKYKEAHKMASEPNQTLHHAIQTRIKHLQLLQKPLEKLQKEIPSMADIDEESEANIAEVRRILSKVDEMRGQRTQLLDKFRQDVHSDDITGKLIISKPEQALEVFEKELKKYDQQVKVIRQNLSAQDNILRALTEINANYAGTRKVVSNIKEARKDLIDRLLDTFHAYEDLLVKAAKGLQFYHKLDSNVQKLLSRVKGVVKVQQEERDARLVASTQNVSSFPVNGRMPSIGGRFPGGSSHMPMGGYAPVGSQTGYPPASAPSAPSMATGTSSSVSSGAKPGTLLEAMKAKGMVPPGTQSSGMGSVPKSHSVGGTERLTLKQVMDQRKDLQRVGGDLNPMSHPAPSPVHDVRPSPAPSPSPSPSPSIGGVPNQFGGQPVLSNANFPTPVSQPMHSYEQPKPNNQYPHSISGETYPTNTFGFQPSGVPPQRPPVSLNSFSGQNYYSGNVPQRPPASSTAYNGQQTMPGGVIPASPRPPSSSNTSIQGQQFHPGGGGSQISPRPPISSPYSGPSYPSPVNTSVGGTQVGYPATSAPYPGMQQYPPVIGAMGTQRPPTSNTPQNGPHYPQRPLVNSTYGVAPQYPSHPGGTNQMAAQRPPMGVVGYNPQQHNASVSMYAPHSTHPINGSYAQPGFSQAPTFSSGGPAYPTYSQPPMTTGAPSTIYGPTASIASQGTPTGYTQPMHYGGSPSHVPAPYQQPGQPLPTGTQQPLWPRPGYHPHTSMPGNPFPTQVSMPGSHAPSSSQASVLGSQPQPPIQLPSSQSFGGVAPSTNTAALPVNVSSAPPGSLTGVQTVNPTIAPVVPMPTGFQPPIPGPQPQPLPPPQLIAENQHRPQSSVDILSELDKPPSSSAPDVLQPKVMTAHDLEEQKEEAQISEEIAQAKKLDPYEDKMVQERLLQEHEGLKKTLDSCGQDKTVLDHLWRLMTSKIDQDPQYGSAIAVARCYPMKNRFHDVLPYDQTRVELPTTKDDYINASHIKALSKHAPKFIATQAPAKNTFNDFWTMVWQEQVETMVCLLSEADLTDVYWPKDRKEPLKVGQLEVTLQSVKVEGGKKTERIFTVLNQSTNTSRVVIHTMLCDYALESIVQLVTATLDYHAQQRVLAHPILVHCLGGSGKTALFLILAAALAEIKVGLECPTLIPDLTFIAAQVSKQRKGVLKDKEHLRQAYMGVALYCRDLLIKHGLLPPEPKKEEKRVSSPMAPIKPSEELERSMSNLDMSTPPSSGIFTPELRNLADVTDSGSTPTKKKMSKQDFLNPSKIVKEADPSDPLSQIDAFWTMKK